MSAALLLSVGCNNKPRNEVSRVPAGSAAPAYEPFEPTLMDDSTASEDVEPVVIRDEVVVTSQEPQPARQVSPVSPPAPSPAATWETTNPSSSGQTYTVKRGDTLWSISRQHYGQGVNYLKIVEANPNIDPNKLAVGQKIVLP